MSAAPASRRPEPSAREGADRGAGRQGARARHQALFFREDGARIKDIRTVWRNACRKAGLPEQLMHDLRRSCVTNMIDAGLPETVAMMISGHKSAEVFRRYGIQHNDLLKRATGKLGAFMTRANLQG
ncbi:MAG TPA: tyrosine-type recombinase/integrase [Xanthobacteraceae bacterium]|nr:tyrosine-type recombinase/integrase [Xanthobacteraceae bacterium]